MGIGEYRHLVALEAPAEPETWACSVSSASTSVVDGQVGYFLRGRYHPGITTETKVLFEGRTLQVQAITDVDERHVSLQVFAVEVIARAR